MDHLLKEVSSLPRCAADVHPCTTSTPTHHCVTVQPSLRPSSGPGSRAPYRIAQPTGGTDSVVLGDDVVAYDCGVKEAQMRLVTNANLVAHAISSPSAGARLPVRDLTGSRPHAAVGGVDSMVATLAQPDWPADSSGGGGGSFSESVQEAQRRLVLDPAARAAVAALPVAGGRPGTAGGERGLRVTRPAGGHTTTTLLWATEPTRDGVNSSDGGAGAAVAAAAVRPRTSGAIRPRDSVGDMLGGGGSSVPARSAAAASSSSASSAPASSSTTATAGFGRHSAARAASQLVGGASGIFLSSGGGAGPSSSGSPDAAAKTASSRLRRPQPVGGRTAFDVGGILIDAPSPPRGAAVSAAHTRSTLQLG